MKPTVIVRSVKRSWPACLFLAGTIQFVSTAPAQAGLFDFLFGQQPRPQPVYAPPPAARPHGQPLPREKGRRDAKRTKPVSASADGPSPTIARDLQTVRRLADVAQKQGITAALMQDPTLRSGDIVVTATGIAVYEGASSRKNPFRPLAQSRLRNRTDLAKLQKAFSLRQLETAAAEGDPMSPLVIHSRGKSTEFQAKTDPTEENSVIEKLGPPKLDLTATTVTSAP